LQELFELAKYIVPSLVVLGASLLSIRMFLQKEEQYRRINLTMKYKEQVLPIRLQAYERLTILMERMMPHALLTRVSAPDIYIKDYQMLLVNSIKTEFEHNLAQQVYVSNSVWNSISLVKNDSIKNIMLVAATLPPDASGQDLTRALFKFYGEQQDPLPHLAAIDLLKNEVKMLF